MKKCDNKNKTPLTIKQIKPLLKKKPNSYSVEKNLWENTLKKQKIWKRKPTV